MPAAHAYLDGPAAKLTGTYPHCSDYIAGLLEKYKTTLTAGSPHIGDTPEEVTASLRMMNVNTVSGIKRTAQADPGRVYEQKVHHPQQRRFCLPIEAVQ
jgi:hypothetical protein